MQEAIAIGLMLACVAVAAVVGYLQGRWAERSEWRETWEAFMAEALEETKR